MAKSILVPKVLRENKSRLLFAMAALNRESRRSSGMSDESLIQTLLDPTKRLWRFWSVWWPLKPGGGAPRSWSSVDLRALTDFWPGIKSESCDEDAAAKEIEEFGIDEEALRGELPVETQGDFEYSLRPFSVWPRIKKALSDWSGLPQLERAKIANAIFALDGISFSGRFSEVAIRLQPACAEAFEDFAVSVEASEADSSDIDEPEERALQSEAQTPDERWRERWTEVARIAQEAVEASISPEPVENAEAAIKALREVAAGAADERRAGEAVLQRFAAVLRRTDEQLTQCGFSQRENDKVDATVDAVNRAAETADPTVVIAAIERSTPVLDELFEKVQAHARSRGDTAASLMDVENRLAGTLQSGERIKLLREKKDLSAIGGDEDIALAECAERFSSLISSLLMEIGATPAAPPAPSVVPASELTSATPPAVSQVGLRPTTETTKPEPELSGELTTAVSRPVAQPKLVAEVETPKPLVKEPEPPYQAQAELASTHSGDQDEPDSFSEENGERCRPIWQALRAGRPAFAYWLSRSIAQLDPHVPVPPPALLRAVALAGRVQLSHGEIARELADSYGAIDRTSFETGPLEWREALSILLIAATLRPCLVAPGTGATAVVLYAHPSKNIHAFRQLIVEAGNRLQGLTLGLTAFRQVGGVAGWEREWKTLQAELADWRQRASRFTLKFGRANDVWKFLVSERGQIGRLLRMLDQQSGDRAAAVTQIVSELADPQQLRRIINHIDKHEIGGRRVQDIQAGALTQLEERTGEALEFAQTWSDLMGRVPGEGNFTLRTLETFRHGYSHLRAALEGELKTLSAGSSRWGLVPAAAVALRAALDDLNELLDGSGRLTDRRNEPGRILSLPLLHSPSIELADDWTPLQQPKDVVDAVTPLIEGPLDWKKTFDVRLARGDAWACRQIVDELQDLSDSRAEVFGRELEQGLSGLRAGLGVKLRDARRDLEAALAYGYIEEPTRGNLDAELASLEARLDQIDRIRQAEEVIARVRKVLQENKARRLEEVKAEVSGLKLAPDSPAAQKLRRVISGGDVFTAHEYLQRIKAGEDIPEEANVRSDAFLSFFPDAANKIDALLDRKDFNLQQLRAALLEGKALDGLDFSKVGREQRDTARSMFDAWHALKRGSSGSPTAASIRDVLSGLGFAGAKPSLRDRSRDKLEVDLAAQVISDRNICSAPSFGSQAQGRYRVIFVWGKPADEDLPRIVGDSSGGSPVIVLYLGRLRERQRRELARVTRATGATFLVLDEILMLHLCTEPGSRLGAFFACALPFSTVKPFVTTSGLVPPEMFFGRTEELKAITDRNGRCFVYGGRQLGKTALLRAAERTFHQPANRQFAAWIDLKAAGIGSAVEVSNIWSVIHRKLKELDQQFFGELPDPAVGRRAGAVEAFLEELRRKFAPERGARLLLLLDEADRFLEQDSRSQYHETGRLKNLMESTERGFKVVFAGLHNVLRTTEQVNHPLAHFGDPVEIGPFTGPSEWNEARDMIRGPLLAAGYQLVSDDLIVRILAQTNYYPVLIQLYGEQLMRILHDSNRQRFDVMAGPRYPVSDTLVDEAYRERSLREAIRARFQYTLQLDQRYEVIAYSLAWALMEGTASFSSGVSSKELRDWAVYWWPEGFRGVGDHEFRIILDEMVGLGVLRHVDDRTYSLRNPNLLRLLGSNEELGTVLTRKREAPVEFEPTIFRAPDPAEQSGPRRSPLTFTQENSFFADKHGVSLVVGTKAGGLDDLKHFLKARDGTFQWKVGLTNLNEFGRLLDARREEGSTVLVIPAEVPWTDAWIRSALDKVRKLTSRDRKLRVVFVADSLMLWQLIAVMQELEQLGLEVIPLRPWNEAFLSQWLDDTHITGNDAGLRKELVDATGLWPSALLPLPARCHQLSELVNATKQKMGKPENRTRFLEELGLPAGEAQDALRLVREFQDEPLENLEVLAPDMGFPAEKVLPRMLWAEYLQLAQKSGKDSWRVEPYLASLLAAAPNA